MRDPAKRARLVEVWDEPWMRGEGAPAPPLVALKARRSVRSLRSVEVVEGEGGVGEEVEMMEGGEEEKGEEGGEDEEGDDGMLLDGEHIDSVATQEFEPM